MWQLLGLLILTAAVAACVFAALAQEVRDEAAEDFSRQETLLH